MSGPMDTARAHWGDTLPDWVEVLARECGRSTAAKVAEQLDRSPAVISQILRNKYPAEMGRIEERVRGVFLDGKVVCPAAPLDGMPAHKCQDWREKAKTFVPGNPTRVAMYRACNRCPRFTREDPK